MIYRRIKTRKGNTLPKTQKQLEAARIAATKLMLTNNPMKNPEIAKKVSEKMKGRITSPGSLFQEGNKFGSLTKGKKISERQKATQSAKMTGRKLTELHKVKVKLALEGKGFWKGKKIPEEQIRKGVETRMKKGSYKHTQETKNKIGAKLKGKVPKNFKEFQEKGWQTKERNNEGANKLRRIATLNNPNCRKNWFLSNVLITPALEQNIIYLYKDNSLNKIEKKTGVSTRTIKRILLRNNVPLKLNQTGGKNEN